MLLSNVVLTLAFFFPLSSFAQLSFPQCVQNCIEQSPDTNCAVTDIECLCRASSGTFLTDTAACMQGNCDNDLNVDVLLAPLELACDLAGSPIPESAIQSAEAQASSTVAVLTVSYTASGGSGPTNTGVVTVTETQGGSTVIIVYPVTEWRTTTMSGPGSTVTTLLTTNLPPTTIVVGSVSTYTTTSGGRTTTQKTTITTEPSSSFISSTPSSAHTTTIVSTTAAGQATTSNKPGSKPTTTSSSNNDASDSAPFKDTNSARREGVAGFLWLSILLVMGMGLF